MPRQIEKTRIDALQFANWSENVFRQMREGGVDAVHATIVYHETFRETVQNMVRWKRMFAEHANLILPGRSGACVRKARQTGRTAIFFGSQNPSCIEDDIGLVEVLHELGLRFMQLSYNNQSLLATGWAEDEDAGLSRMGREVISEMNRVGMVVDMSHSGERSTLEAIEYSSRPIAVTHANPSSWHPTLRNKSDRVLRALAENGGMLGFSLYPNHMAGGSACTLKEFCEMVARTADLIGITHLGIGSDLCQDQPDEVVRWMRNGRWTGQPDTTARFPEMPNWFRDNRDFDNVAAGLAAVGMSDDEVAAVMGGNWLDFFDRSLAPGDASAMEATGAIAARTQARAAERT
jgi:membrane dipeptidase